MKNKKTVRRIVSFGAGINSGAMLVLLQLKKIKIDECIMADVGCEDQRTYDWIEKEIKPYFKANGIKFTVVNSKLGNMLEHYMKKNIIPYVSRRACTDHFKIRPIKNYIKKKYSDDVVFSYIGFDADEPQRAYNTYKQPKLPYIPVYPLIEHGIDRKRCVKLIQALGVRVPPKSRCICCPNRKESGFYDLWKEEPLNFEKVMQLEENFMLKRKMNIGLLNHPKKTLRKLKNKWESQTRLCGYFPIPKLMIEHKTEINAAC